MDLTVDELQERLDPKVIVHRLFDSFRDSAQDAVHKGFEVIRANPIPAALIAIGVAWLVVRQVLPKQDDVSFEDESNSEPLACAAGTKVFGETVASGIEPDEL